MNICQIHENTATKKEMNIIDILLRCRRINNQMTQIWATVRETMPTQIINALDHIN